MELFIQLFLLSLSLLLFFWNSINISTNLVSWMMHHRSHRLSSCIFIVFHPASQTDNIYCTNFKLADSFFACSNLSLKLSNDFLFWFQLTYFQLLNFSFVHFIISISFFWYSMFVHTFFCWYSLVLCPSFLSAVWTFLRQLSSFKRSYCFHLVGSRYVLLKGWFLSHSCFP